MQAYDKPFSLLLDFSISKYSIPPEIDIIEEPDNTYSVTLTVDHNQATGRADKIPLARERAASSWIRNYKAHNAFCKFFVEKEIDIQSFLADEDKKSFMTESVAEKRPVEVFKSSSPYEKGKMEMLISVAEKEQEYIEKVSARDGTELSSIEEYCRLNNLEYKPQIEIKPLDDRLVVTATLEGTGIIGTGISSVFPEAKQSALDDLLQKLLVYDSSFHFEGEKPFYFNHPMLHLEKYCTNKNIPIEKMTKDHSCTVEIPSLCFNVVENGSTDQEAERFAALKFWEFEKASRNQKLCIDESFDDLQEYEQVAVSGKDDPKGTLIGILLKNGMSAPTFETFQRVENGMTVFYSRCTLDDICGKGKGPTKKISEKSAAFHAMNKYHSRKSLSRKLPLYFFNPLKFVDSVMKHVFKKEATLIKVSEGGICKVTYKASEEIFGVGEGESFEIAEKHAILDIAEKFCKIGIDLESSMTEVYSSNPRSFLSVWCQKSFGFLPEIQTEKIGKSVKVTVKLPELLVCVTVQASVKNAIRKACIMACEKLLKREYGFGSRKKSEEPIKYAKQSTESTEPYLDSLPSKKAKLDQSTIINVLPVDQESKFIMFYCLKKNLTQPEIHIEEYEGGIQAELHPLSVSISGNLKLEEAVLALKRKVLKELVTESELWNEFLGLFELEDDPQLMNVCNDLKDAFPLVEHDPFVRHTFNQKSTSINLMYGFDLETTEIIKQDFFADNNFVIIKGSTLLNEIPAKVFKTVSTSVIVCSSNRMNSALYAKHCAKLIGEPFGKSVQCIVRTFQERDSAKILFMTNTRLLKLLHDKNILQKDLVIIFDSLDFPIYDHVCLLALIPHFIECGVKVILCSLSESIIKQFKIPFQYIDAVNPSAKVLFRDQALEFVNSDSKKNLNNIKLVSNLVRKLERVASGFLILVPGMNDVHAVHESLEHNSYFEVISVSGCEEVFSPKTKKKLILVATDVFENLKLEAFDTIIDFAKLKEGSPAIIKPISRIHFEHRKNVCENYYCLIQENELLPNFMVTYPNDEVIKHSFRLFSKWKLNFDLAAFPFDAYDHLILKSVLGDMRNTFELDSNFHLTELVKLFEQFPSTKVGYVLFLGLFLGQIGNALTIAAFLYVVPKFQTQREHNFTLKEALDLFNEWLDEKFLNVAQIKEFCSKRRVIAESFDRICMARNELYSTLEKTEIFKNLINLQSEADPRMIDCLIVAGLNQLAIGNGKEFILDFGFSQIQPSPVTKVVDLDLFAYEERVRISSLFIKLLTPVPVPLYHYMV